MSLKEKFQFKEQSIKEFLKNYHNVLVLFKTNEKEQNKALKHILKELNINYQNINYDYQCHEKVILVAGGILSKKEIDFLYLNAWSNIIIMMPQTIDQYDPIFERTYIFCREKVSFAYLWDYLQDKSKLYLDHDLVIQNQMIETKSTKELIQTKDLYQAISYYLLGHKVQFIPSENYENVALHECSLSQYFDFVYDFDLPPAFIMTYMPQADRVHNVYRNICYHLNSYIVIPTIDGNNKEEVIDALEKSGVKLSWKVYQIMLIGHSINRNTSHFLTFREIMKLGQQYKSFFFFEDDTMLNHHFKEFIKKVNIPSNCDVLYLHTPLCYLEEMQKQEKDLSVNPFLHQHPNFMIFGTDAFLIFQKGIKILLNDLHTININIDAHIYKNFIKTGKIKTYRLKTNNFINNLGAAGSSKMSSSLGNAWNTFIIHLRNKTNVINYLEKWLVR